MIGYNRVVKTIIAITSKSIWRDSNTNNEYTRSTIHSTLEEVGFIHCTDPSQTMEVIPRFQDVKDVILLLIDADKVNSPVIFEKAKSHRAGLFPHIYGPLNIDAVYSVIEVPRDREGNFVKPKEIKALETSA